MAIIKCPECGKEISDKAEACIYCGFPIQEHISLSKKKDKMFIKCPECGSFEPKSAKECFNCGYPFKKRFFFKQNKISVNFRGALLVVGCLTILLSVFVLALETDDTSRQMKLKGNTATISTTEPTINIQDVIAQIKECQTSTSKAKKLFLENKERMNEAQKTECLVEIGKWEAPYKLGNEVKNYLNDPNSMQIYKVTTSKQPEYKGNGKYLVSCSIDYGAKNVYGGMVRKTASGDVTFTINGDNITYEAKLSAYTKWELVQ